MSQPGDIFPLPPKQMMYFILCQSSADSRTLACACAFTSLVKETFQHRAIPWPRAVLQPELRPGGRHVCGVGTESG